MQELTREQVLASLMRAYETAVMSEAMRRGGNPKHFGEAAAMLPPEVFSRMRDAYRAQVDQLS